MFGHVPGSGMHMCILLRPPYRNGPRSMSSSRTSNPPNTLTSRPWGFEPSCSWYRWYRGPRVSEPRTSRNPAREKIHSSTPTCLCESPGRGVRHGIRSLKGSVSELLSCIDDAVKIAIGIVLGRSTVLFFRTFIYMITSTALRLKLRVEARCCLC